MRRWLENLEQFAKLIDEAGSKKADIVCLPEGATLIGTGKDYLTCAEPVPARFAVAIVPSVRLTIEIWSSSNA